MRSFAAAVCLLVLGGSMEAAEGPPAEAVGQYGDPSRLVVCGTECFTAEEVAGRLRWDLDVLLAAHPAAPLPRYLFTLRGKAMAGYRHAGFRDVEVTASVDRRTGQTVVAVEEGPRYLAGEVRVAGAPGDTAQYLVDGLMRPVLPAGALVSSPEAGTNATAKRAFDLEGNEIEPAGVLWTPGQPAPLDAERQERITGRVRDALSDLGYFFTDFSIEFRQSGPANLDLVVDIADLGRQAKADAIEVVGNQRHTSDEILDFLGVKPRMQLTRLGCADMEYRLWQSGRFRWQKVTPIAPDGSDAPFQLRIEVAEYDEVPRLCEKLSDVDETLLRYQRWLSGIASADDIVIQWQLERRALTAVFSPANGLLVRSGDGAAVACGDRIGLYAIGKGKKLVAPAPPHPIKIDYGFRLSRDAAAERPLSFTISGAYQSEGDERTGGLLDLTTYIQPAACLALARRHDPTCLIADGVLAISCDLWKLRVDVESGRLIERVIRWDEGQEPIRIAVKPGEFERQLQEIEAQTADYLNAYDAQRPLSSWVRFLRDDELIARGCRWLWENWMETLPPDGKRLAVVWKILDLDVLDPLDRRLAARNSSPGPDRQKFSIPGGRALDELSLDDMETVAVGLCLVGADSLFPRGSWPSTILRETGLSVAGKDNPAYFYAELADLYSSAEHGPICCLVYATLLRPSLPGTAGLFARQGLDRLSIADFRKDRGVLLDRERHLLPCVVPVLDALRKLDEKETEILFAGLPGDVKAGIQAGLARLRERPDVPVAELLDDALDRAWEAGWQAATERALRRLMVGLASIDSSPMKLPPAALVPNAAMLSEQV